MSMSQGQENLGVEAIKIEQERRLYLALKRTLDVAIAVTGLIFLFLPFCLIASLIKYENRKGTVIFKQKRIGKNGKSFTIYKFRTMVEDAEDQLVNLLDMNEATGALFKMKTDPRVTNVGRILRRLSLDELPQLVNVLKGEMSIVGPRPPLPSEVDQYNLYELKRLSVTPGCTGLWQISGRSSLGFEEMVELDLQYISERSLMADLKIIMRTFKVFIRPEHAY